MLYVAYGSNMNLEQMSFRCPKSKVIGTGKLLEWKLVFNCHADIISGDEHDEVPVVVWDIDDGDWARLDMYEGYPNYYVKEFVDVLMDDGVKKEAVVYVMADNRKGISPPADGYFNGIIKGCIDNRIDIRYLYDALEYSYNNKTMYNQYTTKEMI